MAIFRLYADILAYLHQKHDAMHEASLEEITACHPHFAYYGARKTLAETVQCRAQKVNTSVDEWYGANWRVDSGRFPDFVLEFRSTGLLGDGAIIELKDAQGEQIASFNSTLPERRKDLRSLSRHVKKAVEWYQKTIGTPLNLLQPNPRDCFYIVRTWHHHKKQVRISIVEGSFFTTITTEDLLKGLWLELMREAGLDTSEESTLKVVKGLSRLSRDQIAKTRRIENASVKPRLRVMAEVEPDGNPHTYREVPDRSVNLIFQHNHCGKANELDIITEMFRQDHIDAQITNGTLKINNLEVSLRHLQHKRNGRYPVIQSIL